MSKKPKSLDNYQMSLDFDQPIEAYARLRDKLLREDFAPAQHPDMSYEDSCIELAVTIKRAMRQKGLSREAVVDAVNNYFGWAPDDKRKCLSIHILNHYLSKPAEYPIPAVYLPAIQRITGSLEPVGILAEPEGARIISREEIQELALGKLDNAIQEMQRLKKEFRGKHT